MGQGMDGMNESWEPEEVEESQQQRVNTLLPEPHRLRIEADGLFKRAKKAEEKNKALIAEINQLRAENERLKSGDLGEAYNCGEQKIVDLLGAANVREKQLRAQLGTASGNARLYADKCTALEAELERLRGEVANVGKVLRSRHAAPLSGQTIAEAVNIAFGNVESHISGLVQQRINATARAEASEKEVERLRKLIDAI